MGDWIDIHTQNNLHYVFIPERSGAVQIKVQAANDAHIALTSGPYESNPMTEIHIGGWNNTKSIIRRDRREPDKIKVETPDILNNDEFVSIWIRWHNSEVAAGLKGSAAFIRYLDPNPHPINYIAVRTGWGSIGSWKILVSPTISRSLPVKRVEGGELRWVEKRRDDPLPPDAFVGGYEDGEVLYIARAIHEGSLIPGKYVPRLKCAVVGYGLETFEKDTCEIICGYNAAWVKTTGDFIPPHAYKAGFAIETNNEPLFIGRANVDHHLIPGKVHCHYKTCYLPFEGRELEKGAYEILVLPEQLPEAVVWQLPTSCDVPVELPPVPGMPYRRAQRRMDDHRANFDHHLIPGKVHCHYKTCYTPFEGRELEIGAYEILVLPEQLPEAVVWQLPTSCDVPVELPPVPGMPYRRARRRMDDRYLIRLQ